MGRWATVQRRGGGPEAVAALPPPPAPELTQEDHEILQYSPGSDNTDGTIRLYFADDTGGPYSLSQGAAWESLHNWGGDPPNPEGFYVATSIGNGIAYSGESERSLELQFDPS